MADGDIIERLVVQFDADVQKLNDKLTGVNRSIHGAAASWEQRFGSIDLGKGINQSLNSATLSLISTATSRIGALGAGLSALGPAGIVAAAAITVTGLALKSAQSGADWAASLQATAKSLGIGVVALQEFDYVAEATGIPVEALHQSLKGLNEVIGQVQSGIARAQTKTVFEALLGKDAPEQLRQLGDIQHILPAILDKLATLPASEQAGFAQRLRIDPEVLSSLLEARGQISGLIDEAHRYGIVMDVEMVQKGAKASHEIHALSAVIKDEMMVAFINLAPVIVKIVEVLADAAKNLNEFIESFDKLQDRSTDVIRSRQAVLADRIKTAMNTPASVAEAQRPGSYSEMQQQMRADIDEVNKNHLELLRRAPIEAADDKGGPPATQLVPGKAARAHKGDADAITKEVQDQVDTSSTKLAESMAALTDNVQQHADFEKRAIADELSKAEDGRKAEVAKIEADKALSAAQKRELVTKLYLASLADQQAAQAKNAKIDRDAAFKLEDLQIEVYKAQTDALIAQLEAQVKLATTAGERNALERRILALKQQEERDIQDTLIDRAVRTGAITPTQGAAKKGAIVTTQAAQSAELAKSQQGPLADYIDKLTAATDPTTAFANVAVKGLEDFNSQIVEAIANGKNLGTTLLGVFKSIGEQILELGLEKYVTLPLAQMLGLASGGQGAPGSGIIPGGQGGGLTGVLGALSSAAKFFAFADGTNYAPGGLALVGERGPELVNLPGGSQVIPNNQLGRVGVSAGMGGGNVMVVNYTLNSPVVTQDLLDQTSAISRAHAQQFSAIALQAARKIVPQDMARRSLNALR